jgi:hypothetical protein
MQMKESVKKEEEEEEEGEEGKADESVERREERDLGSVFLGEEVEDDEEGASEPDTKKVSPACGNRSTRLTIIPLLPLLLHIDP